MSATEAPMELVRGPSAVTGDWGRFFRLTWVIAKKDYKLSYFGSVLGYVWSLMQPLLFFGVLYLVFAVIVQFNKGVKDFPVLLLMNIVLFGFFQQATGASIMSLSTWSSAGSPGRSWSPRRRSSALGRSTITGLGSTMAESISP